MILKKTKKIRSFVNFIVAVFLEFVTIKLFCRNKLVRLTPENISVLVFYYWVKFTVIVVSREA